MTHDHRAVLEAIAYGDDPRVTPSDRLRALEHLSRMEPGQQPDGSYSSELASLEGEELDRRLDALLAEQIAADVLGARERWPVLGQLVDREVERRARKLAKDIHVAQVEAEIAGRVEERLAEVAAREQVEKGTPERPLPPTATPAGVSLERGWPTPRFERESVFRGRRRVA
jgi:hypothetical protein